MTAVSRHNFPFRLEFVKTVRELSDSHRTILLLIAQTCSGLVELKVLSLFLRETNDMAGFSVSDNPENTIFMIVPRVFQKKPKLVPLQVVILEQSDSTCHWRHSRGKAKR